MIDPKWHAKHCPPGALTGMLKARFDEPIEEALSEKRIAGILHDIDRDHVIASCPGYTGTFVMEPLDLDEDSE